MTNFTLNISHSDNSCQSGIQHGLMTYQSEGVFNLTAITALYNSDVYHHYEGYLYKACPQMIIDQIQTVFLGPTPNAIKIGTVLSKDSMLVIRDFLVDYPSIPVIVEMTIKMADDLFNHWSHILLPLASVVLLPEDQSDYLTKIEENIKDGTSIIVLKQSGVSINGKTYPHTLNNQSIGDFLTARLAKGETDLTNIFK